MNQNDRQETSVAQAMPHEGRTWKSPYGIHKCPVCVARTPEAWRQSEKFAPIECRCGARFGFNGGAYELLERPEPGEKDVLIRADKDDYRHKVFDYMDTDRDAPEPRQTMCYWSVSGTPRRTGPGRVICFSNGDRIKATGFISNVEDGKIWFAPLNLTNYPQPEEPPTRGFKYVELPEGVHPYV